MKKAIAALIASLVMCLAYAASLSFSLGKDCVDFSFQARLLGIMGSFSSLKGIEAFPSLHLSLERLSIGCLSLEGPLLAYDKAQIPARLDEPVFGPGLNAGLFGIAGRPAGSMSFIVSFPTRAFGSIDLIAVSFAREDLFLSYLSKREKVHELEQAMVDYRRMGPSSDMDCLCFALGKIEDGTGMQAMILGFWDRCLGFSTTLIEKGSCRLGKLVIELDRSLGLDRAKIVSGSPFEMLESFSVKASAEDEKARFTFEAIVQTYPRPIYRGQAQKRVASVQAATVLGLLRTGFESSLSYESDLSRKASSTFWAGALFKGLEARVSLACTRPGLKGRLKLEAWTAKAHVQLSKHKAVMTVSHSIDAYGGKLDFQISSSHEAKVSFLLHF
ncbi:MAG: hypothetical protein PHI83_04775 [Sphaerochaetaceae bacterium]|nr:hypothetical protein [Sphaerochaetaceae bacterium]